MVQTVRFAHWDGLSPPLNQTLEVTVKIHGYTKEEQDVENPTPSEIAEITLFASSDELRRIAKFLEHCADEIESCGKSWCHEHLSDKDKSFKNSPHLVVFNPDYEL